MMMTPQWSLLPRSLSKRRLITRCRCHRPGDRKHWQGVEGGSRGREQGEREKLSYRVSGSQRPADQPPTAGAMAMGGRAPPAI